MRLIICLSGGIATGKTTVAQALADTWPNTSVRAFGDVVRARARAEGLILTRDALQETGLRLISEGWPAFIDALLTDIPPQAEVLIVDGVRHVEPVAELRTRFADIPVRIIYIQADPVVVRQRIATRGETSHGLTHAVEADLAAVAACADLTVQSTSIGEMVARIQEVLPTRKP